MTAAAGWRLALGLLVILPLAGALVMRWTLPEAPLPSRSSGAATALLGQLRNARVLRPALAASALFFTFVSVFSYSTFRLEQPPFDYGTGGVSLVFVLWGLGVAGPPAGRLADRLGWRTVALLGLCSSATGVLLSLPALIVTLVPALVFVISGMFVGVTAAQLGVSEAGDVDRGVASAVYFTLYYVAGAAAGFLPGLAWQRWDWPGVAACAAAALTVGFAALVLRRRHRWHRGRG